jgi:hypothetical protein
VSCQRLGRSLSVAERSATASMTSDVVGGPVRSTFGDGCRLEVLRIAIPQYPPSILSRQRRFGARLPREEPSKLSMKLLECLFNSDIYVCGHRRVWSSTQRNASLRSPS